MSAVVGEETGYCCADDGDLFRGLFIRGMYQLGGGMEVVHLIAPPRA